MKNDFCYQWNVTIELPKSLDDKIFELIRFLGNFFIVYVDVDLCFQPEFSKFPFENGQLQSNGALSIFVFEYYKYNQMKANL